MVHAHGAIPGSIGTPLPGVEIRLEPVGDKHELLVRGPSVATGCWRLPAHTAASFTPDGYYRTGDAGALIDPAHPERGLRFAGRLSEDFKLDNGTWVDASGLRTRLLAAAGNRLRDLIIVGADRPFLVTLAWAGAAFNDTDLTHLLHRHNKEFDRSSTRIFAGAVLEPEPTGDEVSAKGQLVRVAVLVRRTTVIERLYQSTAVMT
jgi:feruloyl-CoA synthase